MNGVLKHRRELFNQIKAHENTIGEKDKELHELKLQLSQTITEYNQKLERKDEQLWALSKQLSQAQAAPTKSSTPGKEEKHSIAIPSPGITINTNNNSGGSNVDSDALWQLEKKWLAREKALLNEIEKQTAYIEATDLVIKGLKKEIEDLQKEQFKPRMERVREIEKDIRSRIEEYAMTEEALEVILFSYS
jgi:regulator of replication initiation timing